MYNTHFLAQENYNYIHNISGQRLLSAKIQEYHEKPEKTQSVNWVRILNGYLQN